MYFKHFYTILSENYPESFSAIEFMSFQFLTSHGRRQSISVLYIKSKNYHSYKIKTTIHKSIFQFYNFIRIHYHYDLILQILFLYHVIFVSR